MAERAAAAAADSPLRVAPLQISKDVPGSDNPIPLSPQWLLPKPGESKPGSGIVGNHVISNPPSSNRSETVKTSGNAEDGHDAHKKKDVFRPSMLDSESGRRDRWRDEERDTKSSIRKDRWRDGDKDLGDSRKMDRWAENLPPKNLGEARRGTPDSHRWNDSGNRETNIDQRRESKWNTRWGPDNKEPEGPREILSDSAKDGEIRLDKGLPHISTPGKDEKEGDHYRPWRPNHSQSRGRIESPHSQNTTPNKQASTFSYGRGRGENTPPIFSLGHGRTGSGGNSLNSTYAGAAALDKVESGHEERCHFRYNRTKLLDLYRAADIGTNRKLVDEFVEVPNLTQDEPLEPLALFAPKADELSVFNGIDKGEIISSSAPQVPKDGRGSTDFTHTRRTKLGSSPLLDRVEGGGSDRMADELSSNRDSSFEGKSSVHPGVGWKAMPGGEQAATLLHDSRDVSNDPRFRKSDMSSHQPKDPFNQRGHSLGYLSDSKEVGKWHASEDPNYKRQLSGVFDSERETRRVPPTAPEELSLFYKDPNGQIQGPFKGIDIIGWFEAGYFGIDLPVRVENSAVDSPWLSLGDAMPHLRAKARPPPGFSAPKPNDFTDLSARQNSSTFGNTLTGLSESELLKSDSRLRLGADSETDNRFMESLMSGSKSSPALDSLKLSEGFHGLVGNNSGNFGSSGVDSGNNLYSVANRLALERQMSLPNPYPYTSAGVNNGAAGLPNYPLHGGLDLLQNKVDLLHNQNFPQVPFGIQQQRLPTQNQLSLSNLLAQAADNPSSALTAEKLLSSGLSQDPQILNMLQQQYLLQLHSHAAAPPHQLPLLDKLLLLKQQQKQEEQQLLLRQQQQQLLSQVLQDQQSNQIFGNSSYGQLQGPLPMGKLRVDSSQLQPPQENFPISSQTPVPSMHNEHSSDSLNLPLKVSQDTSYHLSSEASSIRLPHELFGDAGPQKSWGPTLPEQINDKYQKETFPASTTLNKETQIVQEPVSVSGFTATSVEQVSDSAFKQLGLDVKIKSDNVQEQQSGREISNAYTSVEVRLEAQEPKKASEKKSKKQKPSKSQSSDQAKGMENQTGNAVPVAVDHQEVSYLPASVTKSITETVLVGESKAAVGSVSSQNTGVPAARAWKPAPGFRAKSLLEIQQEEQRKAEAEMLASDVANTVNSMSLISPWVGAGIVSNSDSSTVSGESHRGGNIEYPVKSETSHNLKSKKSQLHDLLAEEVLKKSNEEDAEVQDSTLPSNNIAVHSESIDDSNFIEAKDSRRNRKKSTKSKGSGAKAPVSVAPAEAPTASSPIEKGKSFRSAQQEKEVLPSIPAGPSLGDFVLWKGEREPPSPSPSPAWSTDSGRIPKPTSLRDILKEQEKKTYSAVPANPVPTPQKSQPTQGTWNSASSRSISASSPSKAASPIQINSHTSSQSKNKGDDDLFWGPIEPSKQETKQSDFPQLASQGSSGSRNVPSKGNSPGLLTKQKSVSSKPAERPLSSSPASSQSVLKLKKDAMTKHSEAIGFRDWCENECVRLIGSKDTSFLEFCLKQSRSEAEVFLTENLGSFDPDHEFIDKFLNYKELLPSDVLDMAFQGRNNKKVAGLGTTGKVSANNTQDGDNNEGGPSKGKKKGKKGKKVSPAVLGFNVVSNRIMMGEIQTVED